MEFFKRLQESWGGFSSTKKTISIVLTVCLILAIYFFYHWATKVEYAVLFTNMQADNAGQVVEVLQEIKVPYQLGDEGKTILIPRDQVYDVRLSLAGKGISAEGGAGFELFDTSNLGSTDFERSINYQRALQEELRRTIIQIDAVKQARVHLVIPTKSAFIENQNKPQASIVLELNPLTALEPGQVKAIAQLVAGSVESLSYEDVNIVDTAGNILSDKIRKSTDNQLELAQFEIKRAYEENLEGRIKLLLENIYGQNTIVTMVTAEMDFNQKEVANIVWGTEGVIASEQLTQTSTGLNDSGLPVADPNRDPFAVIADGTNGMITDMSSIKNYEINKMVETEIFAPGRVLSISTAVIIDGILNPETRDYIEGVVKAAIGFDEERGDTINILDTEFDQTGWEETRAVMAEASAAAAAKEQQERKGQMVDWGIKGASVLVILILGVLLIRLFRPREEDWPEMNFEEPVPIKKVEEQIEKQLEQKSDYFTEDEKVKTVIKDEPEVVVQIINNWLDENKGDGSG